MMTPPTSKVKLSELNAITPEQNGGHGCTNSGRSPCRHMAGKDNSDTVTELIPMHLCISGDGVLANDDVAKGMIIKAEYFENEAKRFLRRGICSR